MCIPLQPPLPPPPSPSQSLNALVQPHHLGDRARLLVQVEVEVEVEHVPKHAHAYTPVCVLSHRDPQPGADLIQDSLDDRGGEVG